jgi:hypothetical protein
MPYLIMPLRAEPSIRFPSDISSIEDVYSFLRKIFELAQFSPECNVIALGMNRLDPQIR